MEIGARMPVFTYSPEKIIFFGGEEKKMSLKEVVFLDSIANLTFDHLECGVRCL